MLGVCLVCIYFMWHVWTNGWAWIKDVPYVGWTLRPSCAPLPQLDAPWPQTKTIQNPLPETEVAEVQAAMKIITINLNSQLPENVNSVSLKYAQCNFLALFGVFFRSKSLLELWVTTFLPDWQPPLILSQTSCACALIVWLVLMSFWSKSDKD